jgi:hypothetical protein
MPEICEKGMVNYDDRKGCYCLCDKCMNIPATCLSNGNIIPAYFIFGLKLMILSLIKCHTFKIR